MRIAICDDNRDDALRLESFLHYHDVKIFSCSRELLDTVEEFGQKFDLYMLDIYIEESINGIELARKLRSLDEDAVICFVSSSDEFYREAYDLYDVNYLLKPVNGNTVKELAERIDRKVKRNKKQTLSFKRYGQMGSIPYGNILYISSDAHTLSIHCKDGEVHECQGKLNELATQVDGNIFFRCHQSFLVNMYQVDSLTGTDLMICGRTIPVSRRYYAKLKARYHEILFEEVN